MPTFDGMKKEDVKTEKDRVRFWQDRVNIAKMHKDRSMEQLGVPRFLKEYLGDYDVRLGNIQVPPVNEVYAYVESSIANLIFKNPYVTVNAKKNATIMGAKILESAINYYWRELKTKEQLEMELRDVILAGEGWHKTGVSVSTQGSGETLKIDSEKFYSDRVSFRDIVWNIGSRRPPFDCQWMAQRIVMPTDKVKEKYGARAVGLRGAPHPSLTKTELEKSTFSGDSILNASNFVDDLNFSVLWEIWDADTKKIYLIPEESGHKQFLKKPQEWPSYFDEFPFNRLIFATIPDEPWGFPDIKPWEPQILETIKLLAMLLNHVKRWNRMLLIRDGAIEPRDQDKMEKGVDGTFIPVKTQGPLSEAAQPLSYAAFQPEVFQLLGILDTIKKNINGQPSIDRGAPERTGTRTLGELQFIRAGARSRTDRKVDRIETHIENIARHMIAHMQANFDLPTIVKITGQEPVEILRAFGDRFNPQTQTIVFTKDDIQGEYGIEVKAGSTLPLDKSTRTAILQSVLEQAARLASSPNLPPFVQVVIKELLRDLDIKSLEQAFDEQTQAQDAQNAAQAQSRNVETEKTAADAAKRRAQADQIRTETGIEGAEALLNAAKEGVLPEAIELGRGFGNLPSE